MAILEVLTAPDPRLQETAREVTPEEFGPDLERFVSDMAETMYAAPGVGLAAPQVGDLRRILVADPGCEEEKGGPKSGRNLLVMVNPVVLSASTETCLYEEGCLSVPDMWEDIERPCQVRVQWRDAVGQAHDQSFDGFAAVVVQHEMDHLDGMLILDRVSRLKRSRYLRARKKSDLKRQAR